MSIDYAGFPLPKPPPRIVDRLQRQRDRGIQARACRRHVQRRDGGRCRACGRRGTHLHHLERRSRGGGDVPANVVTLCGVCHAFTHAVLLELAGNPESGDGWTVVGRGAAVAYLARGPGGR